MRQTGRTTKMLRKALELAKEHDAVPILVPTYQIALTLRRVALAIQRASVEPAGSPGYISPEHVNRLEFVSNGILRGFTTPPLLADHTWREHYQHVFDAKRLLDQAEGQP